MGIFKWFYDFLLDWFWDGLEFVLEMIKLVVCWLITNLLAILYPILESMITYLPAPPAFVDDAIYYVAIIENWIPVGFILSLVVLYTGIVITFAVVKWVLKVIPLVG